METSASALKILHLSEATGAASRVVIQAVIPSCIPPHKALNGVSYALHTLTAHPISYATDGFDMLCMSTQLRA
jgi:hypothetical protein